jgi:PAS domain S-box-containing protein
MNANYKTVPQSHRFHDESYSTEWWYSELLEYTHDAIIVWELGGKGILYMNRAAEQLYGYSRDEAYGQITHDLLQTQLTVDISELESAIANRGSWVGELHHTTRHGHHVSVRSRLTLLPRHDDRWLVVEINRELDSSS